jgi:hypothetical protein
LEAAMPTVLRVKGYRFFFFSREGTESPHIHVESGDDYAKFWLQPVELARSVGYNSSELTTLRRLVELHEDLFVEKWHEHFGQA